MENPFQSNCSVQNSARANAKLLKISMEEIEFLLQLAASPEERIEVAEYLAELTGERIPSLKTIC